MSLPYFNLYPTDFEAKTSHLTLEEDGAYNRLLRLCWMMPECSIPDDNAWIMRRMRVDQDTFERVVLVVIGEFFTRTNGRLSNDRMNRELALSTERHSKRVSAGKKGGEAKALKTLAAAPSKAKAMLYQPEPEPEPDIRGLGKPKLMAFSEFWDVWPIKVSKAAAEKAWAKLSEADRIDARDNAQPWFDLWRSRNQQASPIHPSSYLNQKRWNDEQQQPTSSYGHQNWSGSSRPQSRPGDGSGTVDAFAAVAARHAGRTQ